MGEDHVLEPEPNNIPEEQTETCAKCGFLEGFHPHKNIFVRQEGRNTITSTCEKFIPKSYGKLKKEFNITHSEIGQDYTLHRNGKVLCVYPTSKEAKYRRDKIIEEECQNHSPQDNSKGGQSRPLHETGDEKPEEASPVEVTPSYSGSEGTFNLSKKIYPAKLMNKNFIWKEDVKTFIKKLKEEFFNYDRGYDGAIALNHYGVIRIIDKLAGEELS